MKQVTFTRNIYLIAAYIFLYTQRAIIRISLVDRLSLFTHRHAFLSTHANKHMCVCMYERSRNIAAPGNSLVNSRCETMPGREATARPHAVIPSHCFPSTTPMAAAATDGNLVFSRRLSLLLAPFLSHSRYSSFKLFIFLHSVQERIREQRSWSLKLHTLPIVGGPS